MDKTKLSINLGWNNPKEDKLKSYINYINWCEKYNIKLIRIILCKWSLNCIYNSDEIKILIKIIDYAQKKDINIILTLLNFTDFNSVNYLDINDINYSWNTNKYKTNYKSIYQFFKVVDENLLEDIDLVLKELQKFKNVPFIEIMNEIDQINCNDKKLIKWCNNIIDILSNKYPKYTYTCSISNYQKYYFYRKNLNCYVDLHLYSFPTNSAFQNLQYLKSFNKDILYVGEYAKNSDYSYLNDYNTKIYFTSGLWGAYLLKFNYSAMSWWWDDIIENLDYKNIINFYNKNNKFDFLNFEKINFNKKDIKIICENNKKNKIEKNKIIERIINLLKHPLFFYKEIKSIKKFLAKKMIKEDNIYIYKINSKLRKTYYIECNVRIQINIKTLIQKRVFYLYDLVGCSKKIIEMESNDSIELFGCYILEEK